MSNDRKSLINNYSKLQTLIFFTVLNETETPYFFDWNGSSSNRSNF